MIFLQNLHPVLQQLLATARNGTSCSSESNRLEQEIGSPSSTHAYRKLTALLFVDRLAFRLYLARANYPKPLGPWEHCADGTDPYILGHSTREYRIGTTRRA